MSITNEDLYKLELKISEEQTKYRHDMKQDIQRNYLDMDEIKTETALIKQSNETMAAQLKEIKELISKIFERIDTFGDKFVKKEEFDDHKARIGRLEMAMVVTLVAFTGYLLVMAGDKIFK